MNIEQLRKQLIESEIPFSWYCLTGGLPSETSCIAQDSDGKWITYYSERGSRTGLKYFETEEEACDSFYRDLIHELDIYRKYRK